MAALLRRHRQDDGLEPVKLALVDLDPPELLPHARDHPEQGLQRAETPDLAQLVEEVIESELLPAQLALELRRLRLVVGPLGLLDQRHHVPHPEDPLRHAVGMEALELVKL